MFFHEDVLLMDFAQTHMHEQRILLSAFPLVHGRSVERGGDGLAGVVQRYHGQELEKERTLGKFICSESIGINCAALNVSRAIEYRVSSGCGRECVVSVSVSVLFTQHTPASDALLVMFSFYSCFVCRLLCMSSIYFGRGSRELCCLP